MKQMQTIMAALGAAIFMFVVGSHIKVTAYQWMQEQERIR